MSIGREGLAAGVLALGYTLAGAFYWALLNVPESNVIALALSALLGLLVIAIAAAATAASVIVARGAEGEHHIAAALGGCVIGLAIFVVLCVLTGYSALWWDGHHGEIDALFLRYGGITRTTWLHQTAAWVLFLVRWALGLSVIAALIVAGVSRGPRALLDGLRASVGAASLGATVAGVVFFVEVVRRLAYWRPRGLPPTWVEPTFVAIKLAVLYGLTVAVAALVLAVHRRHAMSSRQPARS